MSIYDAALRYQREGTPLVVIAGKEYGSGSSRDWAAKGSALLGVKAVIAQTYERIHRSNLVCMGVLPLQFEEGDSAQSLGLTGFETFSITGIGAGITPRQSAKVSRDPARRISSAIRNDGADRCARRGRVLPPRRHPADGSAPTSAGLSVNARKPCGSSSHRAQRRPATMHLRSRKFHIGVFDMKRQYSSLV